MNAPIASSAAPVPAPAVRTPARAAGSVVLYRLFDVGYEIALERALDLLATSAPERVKPVRGEAQAIRIKNPPVTVILGRESVPIAGVHHEAEISARLFDFGVVSLRMRVAVPETPWPAYVQFGVQFAAASPLAATLDHHLRLLLDRIRPAVRKEAIAPVTEDYLVYRVDRLLDEGGAAFPAEFLGDEDLALLLVGERRPLAASARRELLPHRFSYTAEDIAVLTWDDALVVEPVAEDTDVQYVLEFANAQLLELRVYDDLLDAQLPRLYERVAAARAGGWAVLQRRYARVLADLQTLHADSTEFVERVEHSLKVTDDVYLARIYSAALEIFRGRTWRAGIDRKLGILRDTYAMLNDAGQAARTEFLELAIVLLIVFEIVMAAFRR